MTKPALAAVRAGRALDLLAAHPGQQFSLKEIGQALGVSGASMLAVLQALTDLGYLARHPRHKTYSLGPAAECSAKVVMGDDIVSVATAGRSRTPSVAFRPGTRVPYAAPFGAGR